MRRDITIGRAHDLDDRALAGVHGALKWGAWPRSPNVEDLRDAPFMSTPEMRAYGHESYLQSALNERLIASGTYEPSQLAIEAGFHNIGWPPRSTPGPTPLPRPRPSGIDDAFRSDDSLAWPSRDNESGRFDGAVYGYGDGGVSGLTVDQAGFTTESPPLGGPSVDAMSIPENLQTNDGLIPDAVPENLQTNDGLAYDASQVYYGDEAPF